MVVYLDNNATTPLAPEVLAAMEVPLRAQFGNPASTTHSYGWFAEEMVNIAREQVASLLGVNPEEIVFTSGATEANNLAIKGSFLAHGFKKALSVCTEHKAVLDPLLACSGLDVELLSVDSQGVLEGFKSSEFVSVMLANNEMGALHDLPKLVREAKGAIFHCDATQAPGKLNVKNLGVDLLSLSAHKMYGPKGVGALYVRKGLKLEPLIHGGGHEGGLRSGTLNVPAIVGFGKACEIAENSWEQTVEYLDKLSKRFLSQLKGFELNGPTENRLPGNLNLRFKGISSAELIGRVSSKIAISAGSACQTGKASHVLAALGLSSEEVASSIRVGIGRQNTIEEIDFAAAELMQALKRHL